MSKIPKPVEFARQFSTNFVIILTFLHEIEKKI